MLVNRKSGNSLSVTIDLYYKQFFLTAAAGYDRAGRDGDQVQGQDPGQAAEGGPLQLEEDRQDRHQVSQKARHQRRRPTVNIPRLTCSLLVLKETVTREFF